MNHHFMIEFVDSGLYFVHDENNFITPLLQIGLLGHTEAHFKKWGQTSWTKFNRKECLPSI